MSDNISNSTKKASVGVKADTLCKVPKEIEFVAFHHPSLVSGTYEANIQQDIKVESETHSFSASQQFMVAGERFVFKPADFHSCFPPKGNLGDYSNVLPHVILNRSTLPWEREALNGSKKAPWLALLLFDEDQVPNCQNINAQQLAAENTYPNISASDNQMLTVIRVERQLLLELMPDLQELPLLAHVRNCDNKERAVIISNRTPKAGAMSTVHLVSVEGLFDETGLNLPKQNAISLVSLKHWSFSCLKKAFAFQGLLDALNHSPPTLRLPVNAQPIAEKHLAAGYIPLPHHYRNGENTVSWYRGPLLSGQPSKQTQSLPVNSPDALLRFNPENGLFDCSYAAAWQLGQLLSLQSKNFSIKLYQLKRAWVQYRKQQNQVQSATHLATITQASKPVVPTEITRWFADLILLKGIPFNYLIPDDKLLPAESIRMFYLDDFWLECLFDGAFSLGRVLPSDRQSDTELEQELALKTSQEMCVTGFLLRSEVVNGWPDLQINGYSSVNNNCASIDPNLQLPLLEMRRLSSDVLLCLFQGEVATLDIHEKPEALHFGFDLYANGKQFKELRSLSTGVEILEEANKEQLNSQQNGHLCVKSIPLRNSNSRVINIVQLAQEMCELLGTELSDFCAADFALEMIEGVEQVRYTLDVQSGEGHQ